MISVSQQVSEVHWRDALNTANMMAKRTRRRYRVRLEIVDCFIRHGILYQNFSWTVKQIEGPVWYLVDEINRHMSNPLHWVAFSRYGARGTRIKLPWVPDDVYVVLDVEGDPGYGQRVQLLKLGSGKVESEGVMVPS